MENMENYYYYCCCLLTTGNNELPVLTVCHCLLTSLAPWTKFVPMLPPCALAQYQLLVSRVRHPLYSQTTKTSKYQSIMLYILLPACCTSWDLRTIYPNLVRFVDFTFVVIQSVNGLKYVAGTQVFWVWFPVTCNPDPHLPWIDWLPFWVPSGSSVKLNLKKTLLGFDPPFPW